MNARAIRTLLIPALLALPAATGAHHPAVDATLGWHIAQQGNHALQQIRAESRLSLAQFARPTLAGVQTLQVAAK